MKISPNMSGLLSVVVCCAVICDGRCALAEDVDFAHDVVPVLRSHCVSCHGGEKAEGGFSLNSRALVLDADVVVPGNAAASRLVELVDSADPEQQMPPRDRPRLTPAERAILRAWVQQGLSWQTGFTFADAAWEPPLRPRRPKLPPPVGDAVHPVDRLVAVSLRQHGVGSTAAIDDGAFLRRVSLDTIGLLPTPDELQRFEQDQRPDKRTRWIDAYLARDRDYAEHWLSFWNDLLRNAYSGTGYIDGGRRQITGWLYRSLLENKPLDQFTRELISPPDESSAGFIRGIKWRGNVNASQARELQLSQSVSQVFLGINMKCASCHDSFIDRWTLNDAWGLAAVYSTRPLEIHRCDKPTGRTAQAAWLFPELGRIDARAEQPVRLRQLAGLVTHPQNGRFARTLANRVWHRLMGRGIVHPVDAMSTRPWDEDLLDYLATKLVDMNYDSKALMRFIMTSDLYQSRADSQPTRADSFVCRGPQSRRLTAEQFVDAIRTLCGVWPEPTARDFKIDGRGQGGQLAVFLAVHGEPPGKWTRPLRASLQPPDALQTSLGRPHRDQIVSERPDQLTTLEAISLANAPPLAQLLERGGQNLLKREGSQPEVLVRNLYRAALCRYPTEAELAAALGLLGDAPNAQDVADLLWSVLMLPEFQYIR